MAQLFSLTYIPALNRNNVGIPGAQLEFFVSGTSTRAPIYTTDALTVEHSNPVVADASAKFPDIYLDPAITYRARLLDADGATLPYDVDPYRVPTEISLINLFTSLSGAALTGSNIVRTSGYSTSGSGGAFYDKLSNAVFERVGTIANGSATVTGLRTTSDLTVGAAVAHEDVPAGTTIAEILSATSVRLSANATGNVTGANLIWSTPINAAFVAANPRSSFLDAAGAGWMLSTGQSVTLLMFGAIDDPDLSLDNTAACQEAFHWGVEHKPDDFNITLNTGFSSALVLGPSIAPDDTVLRKISGDFRAKHIAGAGLLECMTIRHMGHINGQFKIRVTGQGGQDFDTRLDATAIAVENCGRALISSLRGDNAWYAGVVFSVANNNQIVVRNIWNNNCGSGHEDDPDWSLSGTWSNPVDSGSAGSITQRTTLDLTVLMPHEVNVTIKSYMQVTETPAYLKIAGELYEVKAIDTVAGTVQIYPWIDSDLGSSGDYTWVIGGGVVTRSGDGQVSIDTHTATRCGIGCHMASQYGAHYRNGVITDCGVGVMIGTNGGTTSGWLIEGLYIEGNTNPYNLVVKDLSSVRYGYIDSDHNLNINRVYVIGYPRDAGNLRTGGEIGTGDVGVLLSYKGRHIQYERPNANTASGASRDFKEHIYGPHRVVPIRRDSQTVSIKIGGNSGAEHRLLGWRGASYLYHGTGTNAAPTGAFTFNPPTQDRTCATTDTDTTVTVASHPWAIINGPSPKATDGLVAGMPVSGAGIPGGTTIVSVDNDTEITISAAATATAATVTLTFTGSINAGFVAVAWSGYSGPAGFDVFHTDLYQLQWQVRPFCGWRLAGSKTWDPGSVADGDNTTTTVTVTGAALGDSFVAAFSLDLQALQLTAYVNATDTVTAVLSNTTGGAVDLASGTLTVRKVN